MITDLDIYRAANLLINRHGANALIEAARMIDRALDHGDVEGRFIYKGEGGIRVEPATAPRSPRPHDV